jgi:hypothetical protein
VIQLTNQKSLRGVRDLPFCYLCGKQFEEGDAVDHDHVPPKSMFARADRQPLKLKTHKACNERNSLNDEKVGQMISGFRGDYPRKEKDRKLVVEHLGVGYGAVTNLDVDAVLWRWIKGFHAALYGEPLRRVRGTIVTPFPRFDLKPDGVFSPAPVYELQHKLFVETIKTQRCHGALDRVVANNNRLIYECVWGQADSKSAWLCFFALNIYEWKRMGNTPIAPTRGCAGCYELPSHPVNATLVSDYKIVPSNADPWDPFGP